MTSGFVSSVMDLHAALMRNESAPIQRRALSGNAYQPAIVTDACTYRVFRALVEQYPRYLSHGDLRGMSGLRRGSVSWALRYLREHDAIELMAHPRRDGYYLYRAVLL